MAEVAGDKGGEEEGAEGGGDVGKRGRGWDPRKEESEDDSVTLGSRRPG